MCTGGHEAESAYVSIIENLPMQNHDEALFDEFSSCQLGGKYARKKDWGTALTRWGECGTWENAGGRRGLNMGASRKKVRGKKTRGGKWERATG